MIQRGLSMKMTAVEAGEIADEVIELLVHLSESLEKLLDQSAGGFPATLACGFRWFHQNPHAVRLYEGCAQSGRKLRSTILKAWTALVQPPALRWHQEIQEP
jgi:hypothetical protein